MLRINITTPRWVPLFLKVSHPPLGVTSRYGLDIGRFSFSIGGGFLCIRFFHYNLRIVYNKRSNLKTKAWSTRGYRKLPTLQQEIRGELKGYAPEELKRIKSISVV